MRKYLTFIVSFSMLFISWLPVGKSAEAKYAEVISKTDNSSPILLQHSNQTSLQQQHADQVADHYSHRSHRSHHSHRSHYSSR